MAMQNRFKPASNFILLIVPMRYFCGGSFVLCLGVLKVFALLHLMYVFIFSVKFR